MFFGLLLHRFIEIEGGHSHATLKPSIYLDKDTYYTNYIPQTNPNLSLFHHPCKRSYQHPNSVPPTLSIHQLNLMSRKGPISSSRTKNHEKCFSHKISQLLPSRSLFVPKLVFPRPLPGLCRCTAAPLLRPCHWRIWILPSEGKRC